MKTLEKLQESYQKELELAKKHQKKANELKQKIDDYQVSILHKKTQELKLSADEYNKLLEFLSNKEKVMSVLTVEEIEKVIGRAQIDGEEVTEEDYE